MTEQEQFQSDRTSTALNSFRLGTITPEMRAAAPLARKPIAHAGVAAVTFTITQGMFVQAAIDGTSPGTTINFADVSVGTPLNFANDRNYAGSLTVTTDTKSFAIRLPNPSQNINIDMKLRANCGLVLATGPQADNTFRGDWQWGGNGTYYNRVGMRALSGSTRCTFAFYAHDSLSSDRTLDLYNTTDCVFDMEQLNVNDGGHVDGTHNGDVFKKWIVQNVKRMGLEFQDQGSSGGSNITFNQPATIDHVTPYNESFGLSIMPQRHTNVKIIKPYVRAGTAAIVSGSHKGIGIEVGFTSGSIDGPIVIGDYVEAFAFSMKVPCSNARVYGKQQWGIYNTEGGLNGNGSFVDGGGNQPAPGSSTGLPIEQAPAPITDNSTPPTMTISNTKAVASKDANGKDQILITWTATGALPTDQVNIVRNLKDGTRDTSVPVVQLAASLGTYTDTLFSATQTAQKWEFQYAIGGVKTGTAQIGLVTIPPPPPGKTMTTITNTTIIDDSTGAILVNKSVAVREAMKA